MRLAITLALCATLQANAHGLAQNVTLTGKDLTLKKVFTEINRQTGYTFFFEDDLPADQDHVSLAVTNRPVAEVIALCLKDKPLRYSIYNRTVIVERKTEKEGSQTGPQVAVFVKGTVVDEKGSPLQGATVKLQGESTTVVTDAEGAFSLKSATDSGMLRISFVGYETREVSFRNTAVLYVIMTPGIVKMEEVVIGYGTQRRDLITGSVATMQMDDTKRDMPTTSMGNVLSGQMAGVWVATPVGIPGTQPTITVRIPTSWNAQPVLYVIDGKISSSVDFNNLSPNDIENVTTLKDAASAAVYGARAAGGVIVVTTRRGKAGKALIQYSFNSGVDTRTRNAALTSAVQTGELYDQINPTSDPAGWTWSPSDLSYFKGINGGWGYDQLKSVWVNPRTIVNNLSVSGGANKVRYFIGGSYVRQTGFIENLNYNKYSLRANVTADVTKQLQIFAGLSLNNNLTSTFPISPVANNPTDMYAKLLRWQPDQPVWTKNGNPIDYGWIANVGAEVRGDGGYVKDNYLKPNLNLSLNYKIAAVEGLSASAQFNKAYTFDFTKYFEKQYDMWVMQKTGLHIISTDDADVVGHKMSSQVGQDYLQQNTSWGDDYQLDFQLNYDHSFGNHHLKGWLIYEKAEATTHGLNAGINTFPVYLTDQWWAASTNPTNFFISGTADQTIGRASWVGQLFYGFNDKYLASFAYRYDGSMNFAPDKRWGFFPSGSVGWVVSKEPFFQLKGIDYLKLRVSAGLTGNDAVGGWQWQQSYQTGTSAYFGTGNGVNSGITYGTVVNPDLTWEKSLNRNIGVDMNFLRHFNATAEYYFTKTYDILGQRVQSIPPTFSRTLPAQNYGQVDGQGVELTVGYRGSHKRINYYVSANASYAAAKYIRQDQNITYDWQNNINRSTTKLTGYEVSGMLRTQDAVNSFVAAHPNYNFNGYVPNAGQLVYKDFGSPSGVHTSDGVINNYDIGIIRKNNNPILLGSSFGAEWKGISIDAVISGSIRQWQSMNDLAQGVEWNRMWKTWYTDGWTPDRPNAPLPARYSTNDGTKNVNISPSDFWYKNASYIRLKALNVGYNLPVKTVNRIGFSNIKIYFSGTNLFIISKFNKDYYDPEMTGGGFGFPIMRSFNFGISASM